MTNARRPAPARGTTTRRTCLGLAGACGAWALLARCGYYPAEEGAAYDPWRFPDPAQSGPGRLVHAALLAACPHNTQPWRFELTGAGIRVCEDAQRALGAMDSLGRERLVGLGCAVENILVAAGPSGCSPTLHWLPDPARDEVVAEVALSPVPAVAHPLFDAIARRRSNRGRYLDLALSARAAGVLQDVVAGEPGFQLALLTRPEDRAAFGALTVRATERILADRAMLLASDAWYRHGHDEIEAQRDGITLDAQAMSGLTTALGKMVGRPSPEASGEYWLANTREVHTRAVGAYGILATPTLRDRLGALRAGQVFQRIHLTCTRLGLAVQPLNQVAERRDREVSLGLAPDFGAALARWLPAGLHAQMVFRVGYAWEEVHASPRRPVAWVLA